MASSHYDACPAGVAHALTFPKTLRVAHKETSPGVWYADEPLVTVSAGDLEALSSRVEAMPLKRARLCVHRGVESRLHEMFIILSRNTYIRPHRHIGKSESLLVLRGLADAVFFDDSGDIDQVVRVGEFGSGYPCFYRIDQAVFHTLVLHSDVFVFKEATSGPLRKEESEFAPWAPPEPDAAAAGAYAVSLAARVEARR